MNPSPQYFLPFLSPDNRVLGILPIATTTFDGTETEFVSGTAPNTVTYPLRRMTNTRKLGDVIADYMAIDVSATDARGSLKNAIRGASSMFTTRRWVFANNSHQVLVGDLEFFLNGYSKELSSVVITPPVSSLTDVERWWTANAPFTNSSVCQFFDVSWGRLTGLQDADIEKITNISLGAPVSDPSNGLGVRAMLVYPMNQVDSRAYNSTLRFLRVSKLVAVTPGDYEWPVTVTFTDGSTMTVNIKITVPN